jgi:hypothetical protein
MVQIPDPEEIEETLREILERLGYSSPGERVIVYPGDGIDVLTIAVKLILVIAVIVIVLYFFFYITNRSVVSVTEPHFQRKKEEQELIEKKDYAAFYRKAVALGKKGDYLEAVRTLYMGLLVLLDATQVITYHPSLTNYEYRQTVNSYPFGALFDTVTHIFDAVYYGGRKATGSDFSRVMDAFAEIEEAVS